VVKSTAFLHVLPPRSDVGGGCLINGRDGGNCGDRLLVGIRIVWHYGWFPPTVSALYLKVPEKKLTFLLLSNCDGLSAGMAWTAEGIRASPYARLFLEHFVSP
jgi:hypothetical protein